MTQYRSATKEAAAEAPPSRPAGHSKRDAPAARIARMLSPRRIAGIYLFAIMFLYFAIKIPDLFLTQTTWTTLANEQAVTTIVAIGLTFTLSAGVFDLSIGAIVGGAAAVVAYLTVNEGWTVWWACLAAVVFGALVGCLNALVVVKFRVDSFIATLGVQAILFALLLRVTKGQQIIGLPQSFLDIAAYKIFGIPMPFYIMLGMAIVAWYVMDLTPLGRYIEATGGNRDAARLAGVRTARLTWLAFVITGAVAAIGGVILLTRISAAGPETGGDYILPVFAAAFLGRTQFRPGRFNIWGTVLAVYLLAMITKGLQLSGSEPWVTQFFYGAVLVVAVALSGLERRQRTVRPVAAAKGSNGANPPSAAADSGPGTPGTPGTPTPATTASPEAPPGTNA
jgi:ribose transport system permease protein